MSNSQTHSKASNRSTKPEPLKDLSGTRHPRVLIFANRGFGDLICDTVLFQGFREALPEARIAAVVRSPAHESILAEGRLADEYLYFNADSKHYIRDAFKLAGGIRRFRPDVMCVSTETDPVKSPLLCFFSGARVRLGEAGSLPARLYTHAPVKRGDQHKVESNWELLDAVGIEARPQPRMVVNKADRASIDVLVTERGWPSQTPIVIHAGSRGIDTFKRWPADRWAALIDRLSAETSHPIVLIGGPDDAREADSIENDVTASVDNLAGKLTLGELAALLERSALVIGNDSGPMHIAASVNAPSVVIFGPTCPVRTRPWGDHVTIVRTGISCSPCFPRLRFGCGEPRCLTELTVDTVIDVVRDRLREPSADRITALPLLGTPLKTAFR